VSRFWASLLEWLSVEADGGILSLNAIQEQANIGLIGRLVVGSRVNINVVLIHQYHANHQHHHHSRRPLMPVDVLVGLQWGSEGKGKIAAYLAGNSYASVRSGGPNSGHTVYVEGTKYVTRHVPCAWVNKEAELYIAAGAAIDLKILAAELASFPAEYRVAERLIIDDQAVVISSRHIESEQELGKRISSTAHGVGAAYVSKLLRGEVPATLIAQSHIEAFLPRGIRIGRVSTRINDLLDSGARVLIEGTQGTMLSLDHGEWPYVTGRNVTAGALIADVGVGPTQVDAVIGVMRTYPIRVGGPSGPLPNEISWEKLSMSLGRSIEPERTTVTGKIRRIGLIDWPTLKYASRLNGCTNFWITFADYLCAESASSDWQVPKGFVEACRVNTGAHYDGFSWGPTALETFSWA